MQSNSHIPPPPNFPMNGAQAYQQPLPYYYGPGYTGLQYVPQYNFSNWPYAYQSMPPPMNTNAVVYQQNLYPPQYPTPPASIGFPTNPPPVQQSTGPQVNSAGYVAMMSNPIASPPSKKRGMFSHLNNNPIKMETKRKRFQKWQIGKLQKQFAIHNYVDGAEVEILTRTIGLTSGQIRTWFKNARGKNQKKKAAP